MRGSDRWVAWVVGVLITVGVASSLLRYLLPHDVHLALASPLYGSYAPDQLPVLAAHPGTEAAHRLGGVLYFLLGAAQFSRALRARPGLHRWMGRAFLGLGAVAALSGIVMGVVFPYQPGERAPSAIFGALLLLFGIEGWRRIRRGEVQAHREWMTRCFAVGLGIGTIRVFAVVVLNATSLGAKEIIAPVFWAGWTATVVAAELWVRATRRSRAAKPEAAGAAIEAG